MAITHIDEANDCAILSTMVAVGTVLADRELELRVAHLSAPDEEVRWVATSELPDPTPFLEGGEILLTTGLQTKGWRREWDPYVGRLVEARVAALGVATALTHAKLPTGLVKACQAHRLNLFEVPRQTTFVAISRRTAQLLEEKAAEAARQALTIQRRLTSAAAKPQAAAALVDTLAHALDGAACVLSADGHVLVGPEGTRRDELPSKVVTEEMWRLRHRGLRAASTMATASGTTVVQPLGLTGRSSSFLAAIGPARLSDGQRSAITTTVALLGLIGEQERSRTESRRRLNTRAVELLVAGDPRSAQVVLDIEPETPVLPARVRLLRAAGPEDAIDDAITRLEHQGVLVAGGADLCAVAAEARAMALATELVEAGLQGVGVGVAVEPTEAPASHATAGLALAQTTPSARVVDWERVLNQGPLGLLDPQRAKVFAASFLGGLDDEQRDTLRCFLRHHGSRLKVAEELGLHRNTVRNRLEVIDATLPGRLDDPQTRVSAWIALQSLPDES
jgi:PucR family transcriptional regulator, purine catabolism regulatory protein